MYVHYTNFNDIACKNGPSVVGSYGIFPSLPFVLSRGLTSGVLIASCWVLFQGPFTVLSVGLLLLFGGPLTVI